MEKLGYCVKKGEKAVAQFHIWKCVSEEYKYSTENLYNAIGEYEYQTCELNDYYESKLHFSMLRLKDDMLKRYIKREKVKDCEVNFNL